MKSLLLLLCTIITTVANGATITLTWDANSDGVTAHYFVHKVIGSTTNMTATIAHPSVSVTIPREAPGVSARYFVTAKSSQGLESGPSNIVTDNVPVSLPIPSAVANLQGTVQVQDRIVTQTLSWTANPPAEQVTQYIVRRYDVSNVLVQSMGASGSAVQMTYPQATMRTDVVAVNSAGSGPVRSFTVQSPHIPRNARITVIN